MRLRPFFPWHFFRCYQVSKGFIIHGPQRSVSFYQGSTSLLERLTERRTDVVQLVNYCEIFFNQTYRLFMIMLWWGMCVYSVFNNGYWKKRGRSWPQKQLKYGSTDPTRSTRLFLSISLRPRTSQFRRSQNP